MIRRGGYGLIGSMGALAMMGAASRVMPVVLKPIEPPIEPLQAPEPRPAIAAEPPRPRELTEGDKRAIAAADAKRQRRAKKRKKGDGA
jgi:hypothetical protein